jgi:hypothetical protein
VIVDIASLGVEIPPEIAMPEVSLSRIENQHYSSMLTLSFVHNGKPCRVPINLKGTPEEIADREKADALRWVLSAAKRYIKHNGQT